MSETVKIKVVDAEQYERGYFPFEYGTSLDDVIQFLLETRNSIPIEYRADAKCDIGAESGYEGSSHATVEIYYYRAMTDEEIETEKDRKKKQAENSLRWAEENYQRALRQAASAGISPKAQGPLT